MSDESVMPSCMRCNTLITIRSASFCSNCGLSLENFCSNDDCELNQDDDLDSLASDARYCHCCGSESTYLEEGLLEKFSD